MIIETGVMIDIETMSTSSNSSVYEIGLSRFEINDKFKVKFLDKLHLLVRNDTGDICENTLEWIKNTKGRQKAVKNSIENGIDADKTCELITNFISQEDKVFANGASFDFPILKNFFKRNSQSEVPWKFWNENCIRTLRTEAERIGIGSQLNNSHDAIQDCMNQIKWLAYYRSETFVLETTNKSNTTKTSLFSNIKKFIKT